MPRISRLIPALIVAIASFTACFEAKATAPENALLRDLEQMQEMVERENCEGAWVKLWPWLKAKNQSAFQSVAGMMIFGGMYPRGVALDDDFLKKYRHGIILLLHGVNNDNSGAVEITIDLIKDAPGFEETTRCLREESNPITCTRDAVEAKLIPAIDDYVAELQSLSEKPIVEPFCIKPYRRKTLPDLQKPEN